MISSIVLAAIAAALVGYVTYQINNRAKVLAFNRSLLAAYPCAEPNDKTQYLYPKKKKGPTRFLLHYKGELIYYSMELYPRDWAPASISFEIAIKESTTFKFYLRPEESSIHFTDANIKELELYQNENWAAENKYRLWTNAALAAHELCDQDSFKEGLIPLIKKYRINISIEDQQLKITLKGYFNNPNDLSMIEAIFDHMIHLSSNINNTL